jgi:allantoinase
LSDENQTTSVDIGIDGGKIIKIARVVGDRSDQLIDAKGKFVMQGAIDPHVHFDEPGFTEREDFAHGSASAAAGGVTTVIDMPCTSLPPVTNLSSLKNKLEVIKGKSFVDYALFGGISGSTKDFLKKMKELEGWVVGYKIYDTPSIKTLKRVNRGQMYDILKNCEKVVALHAEDLETVLYFTKKYKGKKDASFWAKSRPSTAELISVSSALAIAKETKGKLHIVHLSSREGSREVKRGKAEGVDISAETCPHYLLLNKKDLEEKGVIAKTTPPIRNKKDNETLWKMLDQGVIDFVASDHAASNWELDKKDKSIWEAYSGIAGVETLLPLIISEGFNKQRISLEKMVNALSRNAAKRYGLFPKKGSISIGTDADLLLIDLKKEWVFDASEMKSKCKFSPFDGWKMKGKIEKTILRGNVIFTEGRVVGKKGYGNLFLEENRNKQRG